MEPLTFNTSCQPLFLSLPSRCIRHVTHRSGFELCFPCATERRRARRPSSGDARNSWAQEGVLYSKQGGPLGPICHLVVLFLRRLVVVVVAVCSGGTAPPPRPEPTSLPSQPASQPPQIRARAISCGGVGGGITKGPSLWACVGSATSAQLGYAAQALVIPHLDA